MSESVSQKIQQSMEKLGAAADQTARELGAKAGAAADRAVQDLQPMVQDAARDLGAAANTVKMSCGERIASGWDALWNQGLSVALEEAQAASQTCAEGIGTALWGLFGG